MTDPACSITWIALWACPHNVLALELYGFPHKGLALCWMRGGTASAKALHIDSHTAVHTLARSARSASSSRRADPAACASRACRSARFDSDSPRASSRSAIRLQTGVYELPSVG